MRWLSGMTVAVIFTLLHSVGALAQSYSGFVITAQNNIYGAGFGDAPAPGGGTGGQTPPLAAITIPGQVELTFSSVTGQVQCAVPEPPNGPDGGTAAGGVTNITAFRDLSGIQHSNRTMFLLGVFRDASPGAPAGTPPGTLSFSDPENFLTLSPLLNQVFFIGDGRTDLNGTVQHFFAPVGATRLFLGFADGFSFTGAPGHFGDNTGQLTADFEFTAIPEPSTIGLISLGVLGAIGVAYRRRRRLSELANVEL